MTTVTTPDWSDYQSVVAAASLSSGSFASGMFDALTSPKYQVVFFCRIACTSNSYISNGITVKIRRHIYDGANVISHPAEIYQNTVLQGSVVPFTTLSASAISGSDAVANVNDTTNFSAGQNIAVYTSPSSFADLEFAKISSKTSTTLLADRNFAAAHSSGDYVALASVLPPQFAVGGARFEVIFDYGNSTGDPVLVQCFAQTYNSQSTT